MVRRTLPLVLAVLCLLVVSSTVQAVSALPYWPMRGQVVVNENVLDYEFLTRGGGFSYYTVWVPSVADGDFPFTIGVPEKGVKTLAAAEAAIQARATLILGSLTIPLSFDAE
jgi:hypothetical protein